MAVRASPSGFASPPQNADLSPRVRTRADSAAANRCGRPVTYGRMRADCGDRYVSFLERPEPQPIPGLCRCEHQGIRHSRKVIGEVREQCSLTLGDVTMWLEHVGRTTP